nr:unnamed protein product [Callosobruchus chinensis]
MCNVHIHMTRKRELTIERLEVDKFQKCSNCIKFYNVLPRAINCLSYVKRNENLSVKHSNVHMHMTRNIENLQLKDLRLTRSRNAENYHCIAFYNDTQRNKGTTT